MLYFKSCRRILQLSADRLELNSLEIPRHLVLIRQGVTLNRKGNFEGEQTAYDIQEKSVYIQFEMRTTYRASYKALNRLRGSYNTTNQRTSFSVFP